MIITMLGLTLCAELVACEAGAQMAISGDALEEARRRVREFEEPLLKELLEEQNLTDLPESARFEAAARTFFASLDDSAMKLAAIELLDGSYVHVVSRNVAAEVLGPLIRDVDPAVRVRAAKAIGYYGCGQRYAEHLVAMLSGVPTAAMLTSVAYAMGRSGHEPFVPYLVELMNHTDAEVRSTASFQLTWLAPETALEHNLGLLNDGEASVRKAAVQNLAQTNDQRAVLFTERLLDDKSPAVRERAVWALGQLQSDRSEDAIAKRLTDPHPHVRGQAAQVLGNLRAAQHADAVAALLHDSSVVARRYATKALGAMGERRFIERLRPLLDDADDQVRDYAADSVRQLDATKAGGESDAQEDDENPPG